MKLLTLIILSATAQVWVAVPYGIAAGVNPFLVFSIAVIFNFIPVPLILKLSEKFESGIIHKTLSWFRKRGEPWIEKYGFIGIVISVSLASAYGAALAGYILGVDMKKIYLGTFIGLMIEALFWLLAAKGVIGFLI